MTLKKLISIVLRVVRRLVRLLSAWEAKVGGMRETNISQVRRVIQSTAVHDMYGDEDEKYYRKQYWYWINTVLNELMIPKDGVGLDLGCGQGRLTTLLANFLDHGSVTGIDISGSAIAQARKYAEKEGVVNVEYCTDNILDGLKRYPDESVDVVLMTEVVFFFPEWRFALDEIIRVLKPEAVVCIAFRPLYHDALNLAGQRMLEQVNMLLTSRSGNLFGGPVKFTWQTSSEITKLMRDELDMELLRLVGIGCCSGIEGDPLAHLVRPSSLDEKDADDLMKLELALGPEIPDAGRYILAIARKTF